MSTQRTILIAPAWGNEQCIWVDEIRKAFKHFDPEDRGKISYRNLKQIARDLGERLTDEELRAMIDEFDEDQDGEINEDEFINMMMQTSVF